MPASTPPTGRASIPGRTSAAGRSTARARVGVPSWDVAPGAPGGPGGPGGPGLPPEHTYSGRPRPRWGRIALVTLVAVLVVALLGGFGVYMYGRSLDGKMGRTDPFAQITGGRPAKTVDGALNMLLLGSDSRDPDNKAKPGAWRTDTIILLHIPASHDKAYLISIPRDLYVYIPKSPTNPQFGDTREKINAAFAWGGLPLAVQTVEGFTGVRIDHLALIDFGGFQEVVDALGGVDMNIERDITSIHAPHRHFTKGMNHLNGAEALDYVRQRYQFPDGDFARMRHQQEFLKAVMDKAASSGTLANPARLNAFLQAVTKAMTVDKGFSLVDSAVQFHNLRGSDMTFMTSPNLGSRQVGGESVVVSDKAKATALFDAVAKDKVAEYLAHNSPSAKPGG